MVKTMLPVQRNTDEYTFYDENQSSNTSKTVVKCEPESLDASNEPETPKSTVEQAYQDKLAILKKSLQDLRSGTHPEYVRKLKKIDQSYKDRLKINEVWRDYMLSIINREHNVEMKAIDKEFDEKKVELKDNIISDLEEKRKIVENQRSTIDISGEQAEPKPAMTRKLRRRPNDPLPVPDKRRKNPPMQLNYLLDERDIENDLREIDNAISNSMKKELVTEVTGKRSVECHVSDGKLMYEKKWFLRGQSIITVEGRSAKVYSGVISSIKEENILVKRSDGSKSKISISNLCKGKITIKKNKVT